MNQAHRGTLNTLFGMSGSPQGTSLISGSGAHLACPALLFPYCFCPVLGQKQSTQPIYEHPHQKARLRHSGYLQTELSLPLLGLLYVLAQGIQLLLSDRVSFLQSKESSFLFH